MHGKWWPSSMTPAVTFGNSRAKRSCHPNLSLRRPKRVSTGTSLSVTGSARSTGGVIDSATGARCRSQRSPPATEAAWPGQAIAESADASRTVEKAREWSASCMVSWSRTTARGQRGLSRREGLGVHRADQVDARVLRGEGDG